MQQAKDDWTAFAPRIAAGDKAALTEFYNRTAPATHARMLALFRDEAIARDGTRKVYVWLWKLREGFDGTNDDPGTWFALLVNKVAACHCASWALAGRRQDARRIARLSASQLASCLGLDIQSIPPHQIEALDRIGEGGELG